MMRTSARRSHRPIRRTHRRIACACLIGLAAAANGQAQVPASMESWNEPFEPLKLIGNVYYIGASDMASYLIVTDEGHILIEAGIMRAASPPCARRPAPNS